MVAKIAVSAAIFAIDKPYSYRIPPILQVQPGQRVMVPFGRGNRRTEGIVLAVEPGEDSQLKPIEKVLDETPVLSAEMLRLAAFVRQRYFCTFYDAAKAMLPAGLWFSVQDTYTVTEAGHSYRETVKRNPAALSVMEALTALGGAASHGDLRQQFPDEGTLQDALRYLLKKELITSETDFLRRVKDKTELMVTLEGSPEEARAYADTKARTAPNQAEALRVLTSLGTVGAKELQYFTGATMATLRRLEKLGFLSFSVRQTLRRVEIETVPQQKPLVLNQEQQNIFDSLQKQLETPKKPALLYGVTGSGKTSVYVKLIDACLKQGKNAILLVPEIALTPQLLGLMASYFGKDVAVLHSGLRVGERYDEWKRIRDGQATLVVGTRSAVFAPTPNLGLLIVDEEQEHTYKSENTPRYHAREIAIWRGLRENALVLLGSATPSVESMFHGKNGDYLLYELRNRYNGRPLPRAELADMRSELRSGNGGSISEKLLAGLERCRDENRQAILFLNRRGNSRYLVCVDCGTVPQCPRCSANLTYHSANHRLMCHYCGYSEPYSERCPDCGGRRKPVGAGTQRVEQELAELLPDTQVLRMDADTITATNHYEKILKTFREEKIPVLLGTQMVAKGLDFPNVTLVGVLDADLSLYTPSFRAAETTFSMITQVVGRAGRGSAEGVAMVQTMTPEHPVIRLAAQQDYDSFYESEIALRRDRGFPPFADLVVISFSGADERQVGSCAKQFRNWLEAFLKKLEYGGIVKSILGPIPAPVVKINNIYHYRLTVCCRNSKELRELLAHLLREFSKDKTHRGVSAYADVNPYE